MNYFQFLLWTSFNNTFIVVLKKKKKKNTVRRRIEWLEWWWTILPQASEMSIASFIIFVTKSRMHKHQFREHFFFQFSHSVHYKIKNMYRNHHRTNAVHTTATTGSHLWHHFNLRLLQQGGVRRADHQEHCNNTTALKELKNSNIARGKTKLKDEITI